MIQMTRQMSYLLWYMEKHPNFAKKRIDKMGVFGWDGYNNMWQHLSNQLNSMGTYKHVQQWKKYWHTTLRLLCKKKMVAYLAQMAATGNNGVDVSIDEVTERVCQLYGKYGLQLNICPEVGFDNNEPLLIDFFPGQTTPEEDCQHENSDEESARNHLTLKQKQKLTRWMVDHQELSSGKVQNAAEEKLLYKLCADHMNHGLANNKKRHWTKWRECWDRKRREINRDVQRQKVFSKEDLDILRLMLDSEDIYLTCSKQACKDIISSGTSAIKEDLQMNRNNRREFNCSDQDYQRDYNTPNIQDTNGIQHYRRQNSPHHGSMSHVNTNVQRKKQLLPTNLESTFQPHNSHVPRQLHDNIASNRNVLTEKNVNYYKQYVPVRQKISSNNKIGRHNNSPANYKQEQVRFSCMKENYQKSSVLNNRQPSVNSFADVEEKTYSNLRNSREYQFSKYRQPDEYVSSNVQRNTHRNINTSRSSSVDHGRRLRDHLNISSVRTSSPNDNRKRRLTDEYETSYDSLAGRKQRDHLNISSVRTSSHHDNRKRRVTVDCETSSNSLAGKVCINSNELCITPNRSNKLSKKSLDDSLPSPIPFEKSSGRRTFNRSSNYSLAPPKSLSKKSTVGSSFACEQKSFCGSFDTALLSENEKESFQKYRTDYHRENATSTLPLYRANIGHGSPTDSFQQKSARKSHENDGIVPPAKTNRLLMQKKHTVENSFLSSTKLNESDDSVNYGHASLSKEVQEYTAKVKSHVNPDAKGKEEVQDAPFQLDDGLVQLCEIWGRDFAIEFVDAVIYAVPRDVMLEMYKNHTNLKKHKDCNVREDSLKSLNSKMTYFVSTAAKAFAGLCVDNFKVNILPQFKMKLEEKFCLDLQLLEEGASIKQEQFSNEVIILSDAESEEKNVISPMGSPEVQVQNENSIRVAESSIRNNSLEEEKALVEKDETVEEKLKKLSDFAKTLNLPKFLGNGIFEVFDPDI